MKRTIQESIICLPRCNRHIGKIYRMPTNAPPIPNFPPYLLNGIQPLTTFMGPCRDRIWYIIFSSFWLAPHQWCFHWYSCHNEHSMYKEIPTLNPRPHILVKIFKWAYLWLSHYPKYFKLLYIDIFGMQQSTTAYTNNILNSQILAKNLQC